MAADGLPSSAEAVSVVWEKGAKLSYTDPSAVDAHGQARFSQIMRQVSQIADNVRGNSAGSCSLATALWHQQANVF